MTVLSIEGLRGGYSEVDILNGIDLVLKQGEILTIAGTNGAGKSTVAKAVLGLLPRVSGSVRLGGKDITFMPPESRAQNGIGYVPQVANIFPSLSITENLEVVKGVQDRKARIGEMFRLFPALAERKRSRAGRLSGGERQQLAYARALMTRPRVVVLDEPTAALSPALVADSFARIASLASDGISILLIEQRARQALAISNRGAIMDGGRIAMEGPASELLNNEKAADLYLGHYPT
ncbi:ABC transporter ATP-binding protein [Mesorhizobium sp. M0904]|uniref:ABC transporter ATP-binding protein n=1 Tax=Mesorhizobium sp. M0904 TaxID=2957022 RepID=UPI003334EBB3